MKPTSTGAASVRSAQGALPPSDVQRSPAELIHIGFQTLTGAMCSATTLSRRTTRRRNPSATTTDAASHGPQDPAYDGVYTLDKLSDVYISGTQHNEDQPSHYLVDPDVCISRCARTYRYPCNRFCPAKV